MTIEMHWLFLLGIAIFLTGALISCVLLRWWVMPRQIERRFGLTSRQIQVMDLIATGKRNKKIAEKLGISEQTMKNHNYEIFQRLGVTNRTEATIKWLKEDK